MTIYGCSVDVCSAYCPHSGLYSAPRSWSQNCTKSPMSLGCEEDEIRILTLLENNVDTGMLDLSTRLIHRDWPVINIPNGYQMDTTWKKYMEICDVPSLSPSFSVFLTLFILRNSTKHPLHHTHVQRWTEWRDTDSKLSSTKRPAVTCVCVCVSSTAKCAGWATDSGTSPAAMLRDRWRQVDLPVNRKHASQQRVT